MADDDRPRAPLSAFDSPTFGQDGSFRVDKPVGSATISPCGRDVALASRQGLHIIDLDSPWSPPRNLAYHTPWEVADVQWSPFAARDYWVVSTSNQKALVWNLNLPNRQASVEHVLHAHTRAISDINFSAHYPDILATCAVDSFVHCWDLRHPARPAMSFCDWFAGATQVKWNRTNPHILASSHDKFLRIWDNRKGAHPLRSIEAHATKIYGVDWNRFKTTHLVTCSLDRTVKFWDYTKENDDPERILKTPFPVWRARHTPFGYGLLAMPQGGDNDLHLYDRRISDEMAHSIIARSVHTFEGHHDQVKEFLWRPRGNVLANMDERDYQLVSWGADRVLRLHQVKDDVLRSVGYQKGMEVKRTTGLTRKGAPYKTFRDAPTTDTMDIFPTGLLTSHEGTTMRLPSALNVHKSAAPFSNVKEGPQKTSLAETKGKSSKDMDPISWMRGVKIGKRSVSPSGLHQSVSTIMSPTLKVQPVWDTYESLGEEIAVVGDKFSKVKFDEVDMQRHKIVVSLTGPWGAEKVSTHVRIKIEFPTGYPTTAVPLVTIEKTTSVEDETLKHILSDIDVLERAFVALRQSSLEMILRYLLGEQSLGEILQSLQKHRDSDDVALLQDEELSSSDDDDEGLGTYVQSQSDNIETIDPLAVVNNAQYNVPLPKACGAYWANNGTLVCFFPIKQEKEASILDQSLKISTRNRNAISEGFGRLHDVFGRRKLPVSTLGTIEDGEPELDDYATSSSDSSLSSSVLGLPRHHIMPAMAWRGDGFDAFHKLALDGSQKSVGDVGTANSFAPKASMVISLHDFKSLLPAKQSLATQYKIGKGYEEAAHNALVARNHGYPDIADVWSFIELLLQDNVPLQLLHHPRGDGSIIAIARRALSSLRNRDSGMDLSFDVDEGDAPAPLDRLHWGSHPFGKRWLSKALFSHFEQEGDVQMLAMMSCIFCKPEGMASIQDIALKSTFPPDQLSRASSYYPSIDVAISLSGVSLHSSPRKLLSNPHSTTSSAGASVSDQLAISSESNTPPGFRPLSIKSHRRDSQATSLSTSPEHHRHFHRSNSNLSAFAASFTRPFAFSNSAASSPPNSFPKKRISPSENYLGATPSSITWATTNMFTRSSTITEDSKTPISVSISDTEDDFPPTTITPSIQASDFTTILKNQDRFHDEGHVDFAFLDAKDERRYVAYREAYADLLHAWDLPMARCELQKYNEPSASTTHLARFGKNMPSIGGWEPESTSLEMTSHCRSCAAACSTSSSHHGRCANCHRPSAPPVCFLCHVYIRGLASPCIYCGHTLHASCRRALVSNDLLECASGCGCICSDHTSIEMPQPELRTYGDGHARGVSPAITVIADSGINEQEMAGWKGSEWEEMAYESLSRNLRGERRGSGRAVRERASQIWRGSSS